MEATISQENYLKAIAEAKAEGEPVIAATLVRWLNVTPGAVTMALKRLRRDGLVAVLNTGEVALTQNGSYIAERIRFRHHLIERMLAEMFGMEWYKTHDEAERLEHAVSADFEAKLVEKLGLDGVCPHGNEVADDSSESRRANGLVTLAQLEPNLEATLRSVFERDRALLEYLDQLGLRPGTRLRMVQRNPDDTIELEINAQAERVLLGSAVCPKIWVKQL